MVVMTARDRKRSRSYGSADPHSERAEHLASWRPRDPAKLRRRINDTSNSFEIVKISNNFKMLSIICAVLVQYLG